ncbi:hypothetical protein Ade02nite_20300 [Paractinoplanes deccanensis]|uniref:Uncharacterized protein n=1 Tax=Paractinoplanes deccanensis TaxID=113561 RepID=A0ABQ3Y058_9ACTN|nr:hypothetical protein [Actinoplanes deccanensis]GID73389.1 hypothetical protein Ade02nite_20300 [Actinoplanes deccanensis]
MTRLDRRKRNRKPGQVFTRVVVAEEVRAPMEGVQLLFMTGRGRRLA